MADQWEEGDSEVDETGNKYDRHDHNDQRRPQRHRFVIAVHRRNASAGGGQRGSLRHKQHRLSDLGLGWGFVVRPSELILVKPREAARR
jgi:hypothetical protein